ncbi:MAG TPA: hypothetical protein ENJ94_09525 [Gammaproteobacteria bacterium]|nr:hypothetical protein [Gammaproteobacteria bacterium]
MKQPGRDLRRPDPFGVLVLVVAIALSATLAVQAEAAPHRAEDAAARVVPGCVGLPRLVDTRVEARRTRREGRTGCRRRLSPQRMLGLWAALAVR